MPSKPKADPLPRCTAFLWNSGNCCDDDAVPGGLLCPAHVALLPRDDWLAEGYTAKLPETLRPLSRSTGFAGLTEEIALAGLHLLFRVEERLPAPRSWPA